MKYQIPIDNRKGLCSEAETIKLQGYAVEILDVRRGKLMGTTLNSLEATLKPERKRLTFTERDTINSQYALYRKYKAQKTGSDIAWENMTDEQQLDKFCKPIPDS